MTRLSQKTVYNYAVEHCERYGLSNVEMNATENVTEHVLVLKQEQDKYYISVIAKLDTDALEGHLGLKFYVVKTHGRQVFPKMKPANDILWRKQSSSSITETGSSLTETMLHYLLIGLVKRNCIFSSCLIGYLFEVRQNRILHYLCNTMDCSQWIVFTSCYSNCTTALHFLQEDFVNLRVILVCQIALNMICGLLT